MDLAATLIAQIRASVQIAEAPTFPPPISPSNSLASLGAEYASASAISPGPQDVFLAMQEELARLKNFVTALLQKQANLESELRVYQGAFLQMAEQCIKYDENAARCAEALQDANEIFMSYRDRKEHK